MCSASFMTRRSIQLRKAPSLSKPGGFRTASNQQFCTADSAILESANIRLAVYSSMFRHRENLSSNFSTWLREVCHLVSWDVKKISVVVTVVIVIFLDEETLAGAAYSMASKTVMGLVLGCHTANKPSGNNYAHLVFIRVVSPDSTAKIQHSHSRFIHQSNRKIRHAMRRAKLQGRHFRDRHRSPHESLPAG